MAHGRVFCWMNLPDQYSQWGPLQTSLDCSTGMCKMAWWRTELVSLPISAMCYLFNVHGFHFPEPLLKVMKLGEVKWPATAVLSFCVMLSSTPLLCCPKDLLLRLYKLSQSCSFNALFVIWLLAVAEGRTKYRIQMKNSQYICNKQRKKQAPTSSYSLNSVTLQLHHFCV